MNTGEFLQKTYGTRFKETSEYRDKVWKILIRDFFQKWIPDDSHVLDLGAGYGEFINNVMCNKKYALDLNPDTVQRVSDDVEVLLQDSAQKWPLESGSLDVVFTSNFFEHMPQRELLERTLSEVVRCLKPGGRLIAMGPNIRYTGGAYWDFWDHYLPLTEHSLAEVCTQAGLEVEYSLPQFLPYTMVGKRQSPLVYVSLYLRLPFAWRIFGKQFVVIARKEK